MKNCEKVYYWWCFQKCYQENDRKWNNCSTLLVINIHIDQSNPFLGTSVYLLMTLEHFYFPITVVSALQMCSAHHCTLQTCYDIQVKRISHPSCWLPCQSQYCPPYPSWSWFLKKSYIALQSPDKTLLMLSNIYKMFI